MKRPLPSKRACSEERDPKGRVIDEEDGHSMENQTNLNWCTGKTKGKRKKCIRLTGDAQNKELPRQDFYESSHYFIDQLKDEFCVPKADGWLELKDPFSEPSEELCDEKVDKLIAAADENKVGKWTDDEHSRFLEGLRLFGKDWSKIAAYMKTRTVKNIISHGQKFLVRLIRFLNDNESLDSMTAKDAEFFHGILIQRNHKSFRKKKLIQEERAKGSVFVTTRELHKGEADQPLQGLDIQTLHNEGSQKTNYMRWRDGVLKEDQESYHKSLGYSIKLSTARDTMSNKFKISFKSQFKIERFLHADEQDSDSGESQSSTHKIKFFVDDGYENLKGQEHLYKKLMTKVEEAVEGMPDVRWKSHEEYAVIIKFEGYPEFEIFSNATVGELLTSLNLQGDRMEKFEKSHPVMLKHMKDRVAQRMEEHMNDTKEGATDAFTLFIQSLTSTQLRDLVNGKVMVYVKHRQLEEFKAGLDTVTNFAHQS